MFENAFAQAAESRGQLRDKPCSCGQRMYEKDVVQRGYYLRRVGANFVYIRYRFPKCERLGEQFIR